MSGNKKRSIFFNLLLMIASIIATLLITEWVFRMVLPQDLTGSWFVPTDNGLLVNKSSGTARHQHGDRIVRYSFYEPNFRGTPIKENGIKILVVGDSFTFGLLLEKEYTYVYHLQQYTDKEFGEGTFQYLNAAVGGWGTADYVAYIEDFGNIVKPDIILVFFNAMDINRSVNRGIYTLSDKNKLMLNRHILKIPRLKYFINSISCYQWLIENSHLVQFVKTRILTRQYNNKIRKQPVNRKTLTQKPSSSQPNISHEKNNGLVKQTVNRKTLAQKPTHSQSNVSHEKGRDLVKALFKHLKTWCNTNHISLCVTTTGWDGDNMRIALNNTSEFFQSIDVPFFDITPTVYEKLRMNHSEFIIQGDGHPNEKGSKLIADMSWKYFIRKQLHEYYRTTGSNNFPRSTAYQNNK